MARITTAGWLASILLVCAGTTEAQTIVAPEGNSPSISGDGRYVAFASEAYTWSRSPNGVSDVFVYDLQRKSSSPGKCEQRRQ